VLTIGVIVRWLLHHCKRLHDVIRDDQFLVGRELRNVDQPNHGASDDESDGDADSDNAAVTARHSASDGNEGHAAAVEPAAGSATGTSAAATPCAPVVPGATAPVPHASTPVPPTAVTAAATADACIVEVGGAAVGVCVEDESLCVGAGVGGSSVGAVDAPSMPQCDASGPSGVPSASLLRLPPPAFSFLARHDVHASPLQSLAHTLRQRRRATPQEPLSPS
jgi:hypothetical protein